MINLLGAEVRKMNEAEKQNIGCYSNDPDNDKHNWPEYSSNENGDEVSTCQECGVDFFGYANRVLCYHCHND